MLSIPCVRLTIKVKVGIPESFKVGWYPPKKTGSSHLKESDFHLGLYSSLTSANNLNLNLLTLFLYSILTLLTGASIGKLVTVGIK